MAAGRPRHRRPVCRQAGTYNDFLTKLAQASGIETPTLADLAKLDRKRKNKGSNQDWEHPHDPDARIAKMKDGRTHLAHKAEHAVDPGDRPARRLAGERDRSRHAAGSRSGRHDHDPDDAARSDRTTRSLRCGHRRQSEDRGTNWSPTRAITASKPCSICRAWDCAPTSVNRIAVGSTGSISTPSATRCIPIGGAFRASAASS